MKRGKMQTKCVGSVEKVREEARAKQGSPLLHPLAGT